GISPLHIVVMDPDGTGRAAIGVIDVDVVLGLALPGQVDVAVEGDIDTAQVVAGGDHQGIAVLIGADDVVKGVVANRSGGARDAVLQLNAIGATDGRAVFNRDGGKAVGMNEP